MKKDISINIYQISTGFIEVPNQVSLYVYVQGCEKRCNGCQNPELQSFTGGYNFKLDNVDKLISEYPLSKWICWLGGDAVYQPEAFNEFNKKFKSNNLMVCLYTGKIIEELDNQLLCNLDMIIDGEWSGKTVQDLDTNQRIWMKNPVAEWYQVFWKDLQQSIK